MSDTSELYIDQAIRSCNFADRNITSAYTSYGIRCMDTDFFYRITNLHNPVKGVYDIVRRPKTYIDQKGITQESCTWETVYEERDLKNKYQNEIRVIWLTPFGETCHDFFYSVRPTFNPKSRKETKKRIEKDIKENPHLHKEIKKNLLFNLKAR